MDTQPQLPADGAESRSVGHTHTNQVEAQSEHNVPRTATDVSALQRPGGHLDFQDSNLSPALSLLPAKSGIEHNFTEYSLFQQSDNEFAPLRAYPDVSMASAMFPFPPHDQSIQVSEHESLSQHPLAQTSILSEEGASCSGSQDSLSPKHEGKQAKKSHYDLTTTNNREKGSEATGSSKSPEDELFFLRKDVSAKQLLDLLQKDVGMLSSSSAVSSDSGDSVKSITYLDERPTQTDFCKLGTNHSMTEREGPPGEASLSRQQTQQPNRLINCDQSQMLSSEVCNITMGSRSTQPDDSTELLHRELLAEAGRHSACEAESRSQQQKGQSLTPNPTEMPKLRTNQPLLWTGPFSAGVTQTHREQDLWSSGNQTGIDGSYLGFLPQSQSTPGVLKMPPKSTGKANIGQLSVVHSSKDDSCQTNSGISSQPAVPVSAASLVKEEATAAKVQSLPSLSYVQKVDAWRANQSSGKTSLFDSLALQGFSGISPKRKAYDAVSDTLNHILSQHVNNLQAPVSSAANQTVTQSSARSGSSSPTRGEAVGSAPNDKENAKARARPSSSPFGRSQSHSSLSTVVMLVQKEPHTDRPAEKQLIDEQQPRATGQPSPLMSLGHCSDVSVDKDVALSSSQDSYNSGIKLGTSIGTSSVTSLEVDNYAPYWTKLSTPPPLARPRELNIEERIPLYLHNLGIDQSPSAILTPFVPRGPIREPEFSPTDLCTIKGSVGTPSKSAQPSEGGSPHKGEFSRSSILSVDSSVSIPLSLDSLGPAVFVPEQIKETCSSSDAETQSQRRLASSPQLDEDAQPIQHEDSSLTSTQNTDQTADRFASIANCVERNVSPMQPNCNVDQRAEDSFVSSRALCEIRKLLSQAENVVSATTSATSSASAALPRLLSDSDVFLSMNKKTTRLQDSLFSASSSSAAEDPRNHSFFLGARSSSDSVLMLERPRQSSVCLDSVASLRQPVYPSTQAPAAQRDPDGGAAGPSVLSKSARRAEPEGCSAAPHDNKIQPPVIKPLPSASTQPTAGDPEEEQTAQSSSSSPPLEDMDQGGVSDGSSESSLAVRVANLLQSDSSATVASSTTSISDQQEKKAREWLRQTISGQQCKSVELGPEDRERIEEIKRELLLKKPMKSQSSTDTESSASSSAKAPMSQDQSQPTEKLAPLTQQSFCTDLLDPSVHPPISPGQDLEAQVREIAAREGVTLPKTNRRAITSITIATRRRSTSPYPPTSPAPPLSPALEPLRLAELSTGADHQPQAAREPPPTREVYQEEEEPALVLAPNHRLYTTTKNLDSHVKSGCQKRQSTVGGQAEGRPLPLRRSDSEELSIQKALVSDGPKAALPTGSLTSESPARTGHISHVHLTLSPKTADHSLKFIPSTDAGNVQRLQRKELAPLRHSSEPSSPDEGVGLSSPPEWLDSREPKSQGATSNLFQSTAPQERMMSTQSFPQQHRPEVSSADLPSVSPAAPVLLPYKPHGSEELFYVPQAEADASDTTMESSHTGSDDAVPPHFSSEVLGHQDPGLDRGVNIRHTEGIYSKRLKTAPFRMQQRGQTDKCSQTDVGQTPKAPSQVSVAFTQVPLSSKQECTKRDQGTSPVQFHTYDRPEPSRREFQFVRVGADRDDRARHKSLSSVPEAGWEQDQRRRSPDVPQQTSSGLDQLWQRFCDQWTLEETQPTRERDASLLDRLERLSRLIHSTRASDGSKRQQKKYSDSCSLKQNLEKTGSDAAKEAARRYKTRGTEQNIRGSRRAEDDHTWTWKPQVEETLQPVEEASASNASSLSHSSLQSQRLCPADKDDTESTVSGSVSTINTERLVRAFGAHRVQRLQTSSSLRKLYSAINRQKDGREQRTGRNTENTGTDESLAADSSSTYSLPSHRGLSKKSVRLVSKGIQAGDLEIVRNGTRRHTRDVGTTFPSPHETRAARTNSSSSSGVERGRGGTRSPSKSHTLQQPRKSKRSSSKPQGVSWFISADNLRSDAKKENQPEESRPSTAWFEPYSRGPAWREPLRQRQVHEDRTRQPVLMHDAEIDPEPGSKALSSGLTRVSLQEALEMRRPEFISRSRRRMRRLALQVEERKLQSVVLGERGESLTQTTGQRRLPNPAGTALIRRAVPRKEMIQRSKQIYENLPEVQRRREEERRKAEYRSYRLNAQLYNKRITSRVLGRSAWQ